MRAIILSIGCPREGAGLMSGFLIGVFEVI